LSKKGTPEFNSHQLWTLNLPDLNPVDKGVRNNASVQNAPFTIKNVHRVSKKNIHSYYWL